MTLLQFKKHFNPLGIIITHFHQMKFVPVSNRMIFDKLKIFLHSFRVFNGKAIIATTRVYAGEDIAGAHYEIIQSIEILSSYQRGNINGTGKSNSNTSSWVSRTQCGQHISFLSPLSLFFHNEKDEMALCQTTLCAGGIASLAPIPSAIALAIRTSYEISDARPSVFTTNFDSY